MKMVKQKKVTETKTKKNKLKKKLTNTKKGCNCTTVFKI